MGPALEYDVVATVARISAEAKTRGLSEGALCMQAGLARNRLAMARGRGDPLDDTMLVALCAVLGKTVAWATGDETADTLSAILPAEIAPDREVMLSFRQLVRSDLNPRKDFGGIDAPDLQELADSIAENGVLQNLLVRPARETDRLPLNAELTGPDLGKFVIVFGERRHRAIELLIAAGAWSADLQNIPARVRPLGDDDHLALALLENLQRRDMNPLEEAEAFQKLQAIDPKKWSTKAIAKKIGFTQRHVQIRMKLVTDLLPDAQTALREGKINVAQARVIVMADAKKQKDLLKRATDPEDPEDAQALRWGVVGRWMHASKAIFPLTGDDAPDAGETYQDEETGELWFTQREKFLVAQTAAAKRQAETIKTEKSYSFTRKVDYVDAHQWMPDKKNPKAGVLYKVDAHNGAVTFMLGYREKTAGEKRSPRVAGETREQKAGREARVKAEELFEAGLATEIAKDGNVALRILILSMFSDYREPMPFMQLMEDVDRDGWDLPAKLASVVGTGMNGALAKGKTQRDLVKAVMALTDNQALAIVAQAVAQQVNHVGAEIAPGSLEAELSAALGVAIPAELLPDQADIEDAAPKSKKRAAE